MARKVNTQTDIQNEFKEMIVSITDMIVERMIQEQLTGAVKKIEASERKLQKSTMDLDTSIVKTTNDLNKSITRTTNAINEAKDNSDKALEMLTVQNKLNSNNLLKDVDIRFKETMDKQLAQLDKYVKSHLKNNEDIAQDFKKTMDNSLVKLNVTSELLEEAKEENLKISGDIDKVFSKKLDQWDQSMRHKLAQEEEIMQQSETVARILENVEKGAGVTLEGIATGLEGLMDVRKTITKQMSKDIEASTKKFNENNNRNYKSVVGVLNKTEERLITKIDEDTQRMMNHVGGDISTSIEDLDQNVRNTIDLNSKKVIINQKKIQEDNMSELRTLRNVFEESINETKKSLSKDMFSNNSRIEGLLMESNDVVADRIMTDNSEIIRKLDALAMVIKAYSEKIEVNSRNRSSAVTDSQSKLVAEIKDSFSENMLFNQGQHERLIVMDDQVQQLKKYEVKNRRLTLAMITLLGINTGLIGMCMYLYLAGGGM